jgi:hypothetical protein
MCFFLDALPFLLMKFPVRQARTHHFESFFAMVFRKGFDQIRFDFGYLPKQKQNGRRQGASRP